MLALWKGDVSALEIFCNIQGNGSTVKLIPRVDDKKAVSTLRILVGRQIFLEFN